MLNSRFLDLARLLPSLASMRRPSKSAIVNQSISHISLQRAQRLSAAREVRNLYSIKSALLAELNEWRLGNGMVPKEDAGWTRAMDEITSVEREVFGDFSAGMGPDGEGELDDEGDAEGDVDDQQDEDGVTASAPRQIHAFDYGTNADMPFGVPSLTRSGSFTRAELHVPSRQMSFAATESTLEPSPSLYAQARFAPLASSPIEQNLVIQAFLHGGAVCGQDVFTKQGSPPMFKQGSPHGSPLALSNGVVTPPPQDRHLNVATFHPPSPPTAATSFAANMGVNEDQVSEWASQQLFLQQYAMESAKAVGHDVGESMYAHSFGSARVGNGLGMINNSASQLSAAHQALLVHQPQLAAVTFPPPFADASPRSLGSHSNASFSTPSVSQSAHHQQLQQFLAASAAAQAAVGGMPFEQVDHWARFAQISRGGLEESTTVQAQVPTLANAQAQSSQQPSMHDFRQAIRAGISMGLAAGIH